MTEFWSSERANWVVAAPKASMVAGTQATRRTFILIFEEGKI
jgi:hypothetical protein